LKISSIAKYNFWRIANESLSGPGAFLVELEKIAVLTSILSSSGYSYWPGIKFTQSGVSVVGGVGNKVEEKALH
jgi:hypothetical protein